MKTIALCSCLCRQWHKFKAAGKHVLSIKKKNILWNILLNNCLNSLKNKMQSFLWRWSWWGNPQSFSKRHQCCAFRCVWGQRLCFCMCESGFSVMWSVGLKVFKTFIQYYNQSNKRYQVGNIGQFCSTLHHVCAGSIFSDLCAQFGGFSEEKLGWDNEGLCAYEDR